MAFGYIKPPPERRCTGWSRQRQARCDNWARPGLSVCYFHGGSGKHVQRKMKSAVAAREAAKAIRDRAGLDADPFDHLLDSLYYAAAMLAVWDSLCESLPTDEQTGKDRTGAKTMHPFYTERNHWAKERASIAEKCIKAKIGERAIQLKEGQAQIIADVLRATVGDPDCSLSPEVQQRVLSVAAKHLRALPAG